MSVTTDDIEAARQLKPVMIASLQEFRNRYPEVKSLITLKSDAPIPFEEIAAERAVPQLAEMPEGPLDHVRVKIGDGPTQITMDESPMRPSTADAFEATGNPVGVKGVEETQQALAVRVPVVLQTWERALDPRDMVEARVMAQDMFAARLFNGFGNAPACLAAIVMGRELGLSAIASLRGIHVIEGRPSLSAGLMVALVLRSGLAEYFEPVTISDTVATFVTKRKGARREVTLTHSIEMAEQAGLVKPNSNWLKVPTDMLVARCQARLARLVYPDLLAGLYSAEEVEEFGRAA